MRFRFSVSLFFFLLCLLIPLSSTTQVATASPEVPFANVSFDANNIPAPVPPPKEVRDFFEVGSVLSTVDQCGRISRLSRQQR